MTMQTKNLGNAGENLAENLLMSKNYKILAKNFRFGRNAEIVVEVKTRSNQKLGRPAEAVTVQKQKKIILAANKFLQMNNFFDRACRFDVIEILADNENWKINHIENAFEI